MGSSLNTVKNQALIANYSINRVEVVFYSMLSVVTIYTEGNLFVEGLFSRFYSIFNSSSQLKTFRYPQN